MNEHSDQSVGILGYVSQCEACGQRAITRDAHGSDWVCPRCAEVAEPVPYTGPETGHDLGSNCASAAEFFPQHRHGSSLVSGRPGGARGVQLVDEDDDGPDLRKIQG